MVQAINERYILGTVQFGLDYGINNTVGKINDENALRILTDAYQKGLRTLDTSNAYGNAEERIGNVISASQLKYEIVSKLGKCKLDDVQKNTEKTLSDLKTDVLYGYLLHHFEFYEESPQIWNHFLKLKESKRVKKIGFSLYHPVQLEKIFNDNLHIDLIQIPFNVLDQRFEPYLQICKNKGIEIHVRSIFLQGLFFKKTEELPAFFSPIKNKLQHIQNIAGKLQMQLNELLIAFVFSHTQIDRIVFGVDKPSDLNENLIETDLSKIAPAINELKALSESNEQLILPIHWKS